MSRTAILLTACWLLSAAPVAAQQPVYEDRWFYASHNLQVEKSADELIKLIERAARAGYNGVVLADYKLNILDRVPKHYFANAERVKKAARDNRIEIIPAVFPVGYSSGLLAHDPNLAEGLPVKDAPYVVKGGVAELVPEKGARLRNGSLEDVKGDRFVGWGYQDDPGKKTFADTKTMKSGKVSCRMENFTAGDSHNARLTQRVKVRPWACYRLSAWVKSKDLTPAGNFKLMAMGKKGPLTFQEGELRPTEDWKAIDVVFNSQDNDNVSLYAGVWGGKSGAVWVDELALEELSLVNALRRSGCPFVVKSADGRITYEEGKDYEKVRDEKLGNDPWAGEYSFAHKGPPLRLTKGSRIRDGDKLLVSWYHPVKTHSFQVTCSLIEPKVFDVLREQAKLVKKHFAPKTWFFSHDEIRVAGWDDLAVKSKKTPGQLLADNVKKCVEIVREIDPKARIVVWSDMFDPNHNAVDRYYLVNGTLKGSWEGLPKDVDVANWNSGKSAASLKWFAQRGHRQVIAGYYDGGMENFVRWQAAAKGVKGVRGFIYTTWQGDYKLLEKYGEAMNGK
jgi:hypothetical protein